MGSIVVETAGEQPTLVMLRLEIFREFINLLEQGSFYFCYDMFEVSKCSPGPGECLPIPTHGRKGKKYWFHFKILLYLYHFADSKNNILGEMSLLALMVLPYLFKQQMTKSGRITTLQARACLIQIKDVSFVWLLNL
jgi:hypothetical protein